MSNYAIPSTMSDCILRVSKMVNGFEVEVQDPKIVAENAKPRSGYKDPWKCYAFNEAEEVGEFITAVLPKLAPPDSGDEFAAAFKAAVADEPD